MHVILAVFIYTGNTFGLGTGIVAINIDCNGNELSIWRCSNNNYYDRNSAGLRCENSPINEGKSMQLSLAISYYTHVCIHLTLCHNI